VILRLLGVERSCQAVWHGEHRLANSVPDPPRAKPSRAAIDKKFVKVNGNWSWVYTATELDAHYFLMSPYSDGEAPIGRRIPAPINRETRSLWHRVSRWWLRLSDCPLPVRVERPARLRWSKPI